MDITMQHSSSAAKSNINDTPQLLDDLAHLLNDTASTDIVLIVGKEEIKFHAHKIILLARCQNFHDHQKVLMSELSPRSPKYNKTVVRYPNFDTVLFNDVLTYIYTGKISLGTTDTNTFEVLNISKVLGLGALREHCENLVYQSLCAENACGYLAASVRNGKPDELHNQESFACRCIDFILENAEKCVKTTGWLQLTKEALIRIISTDTFSLKEEEVWRAVLSWAKYNADIPMDKQSQVWTEIEKGLLKKQLQGIIEHVRLLLIDSKVFAEEIEPTGLIPMEVSLERYRLAAVPDQIQQSRLRPRSSAQLFLGTHILCKGHLHFQRVLNNWYGDASQTWRLLYRATRDGSTADWFHKLCDGYSMTFVIVKGKTGNIFGGFSDVPWTSQTPPTGSYKASNRSFLFSLVNNNNDPPTKYDIKRQKYAIVNHQGYGPIFGAGADLCIASNCLDGEECYSHLPHSYDTEITSNRRPTLNGTQYFDIEDYEVFILRDFTK